jgi:hypothetical protein
MINSHHWRIATAAAILTMLAGSVASRGGVPSRSRAGAASQHRIPRLTTEMSVTPDRSSTRTMRQPTGAGVAAPLFIPEL